MKKKFKEIREEKGVTVAHVALFLGVCEATIRNKEKGRTDFTAPEARRLCRLYNVSFDDVDF